MPRMVLRILVLFIWLCLAAAPSSAQSNDQSSWNRVLKLIKKRHAAKAYAAVENIYQHALRRADHVGMIRALAYKSGIRDEITDDNEKISINELENILPMLGPAAKAVVKSLLAEQYRLLFEDMRYQLPATQEENASIEKWTARDFENKIATLYAESIEDSILLQHTTTAAFEGIIVRGNASYLRPTLFDMLADRLIHYYDNDNYYSVGPRSENLKRNNLFVDSKRFVAIHLLEDSTNTSQVLRIYQQLERMHLNDVDPAALIDLQLKRFAFLQKQNRWRFDTEQYLPALTALTNQYPDHPVVAQAWYLLANHHAGLAKNYQPFTDTAYRFELNTAKEICERVLTTNRNTEGGANCYNLLHEINSTTLNLQIEAVNLPATPFRVLISYKDAPTVYFRIIEMDEQLVRQLSTLKYEEYWEELKKIKPYRAWSQWMPATNDHQLHHCEVKIDALPTGRFYLLAGDETDFRQKSATVTGKEFNVSNIAYVKNESHYFTIDRSGGKPLTGARIEASYTVNDARGKYLSDKDTVIITGSDGHFELPANKQWRFTIHLDKDRLSSETTRRYGYDNNYDDSPQNEKAFFYTDRSIYRPGQTVYFKAIVVSNEGEKNLSVHRKIKVLLKNASYRIIDTLEGETSEYGSIHGEFRLPPTVLTGQFQLEAAGIAGFETIAVEEYKRPNFSATFENIREIFSFDDSVTLTGSAKNFAGNALTGAKVKYTITKNVQFPKPYYYRYAKDSYLISETETITNDSGSFYIGFRPVHDTSFMNAASLVNIYTVRATITDLTGESHEIERSIVVKEQPLEIAVTVPKLITSVEVAALKVVVKNNDGIAQQVPVKITIHKLQDEKRLIRDRYWRRPDQFIYSKEEFIRHFPLDEYANELDHTQWPVESTVQCFTANPNQVSDSLSRTRLQHGYYRITAEVADPRFSSIETSTTTQVYSSPTEPPSSPAYMWTSTDERTSALPGDTASISFTSSVTDLHVLQFVDRMTAINYEIDNVTTGNYSKEVKVDEEDRGGLLLSACFVRDNRFYTLRRVIEVPFNNKQLHLKWTDIHKSMEPGSEQMWKLRITDHENKPVHAEVAITMYDASLDEITPHNYSTPLIWRQRSNFSAWSGGQSFTTVAYSRSSLPDFEYDYRAVVYDKFLHGLVATADRSQLTDPLWWLNPLDYVYSETRSPKLMRLPKPVFPDADSDGVPDAVDVEKTPAGCPVDVHGRAIDSDGNGTPDCMETEAGPKENEIRRRKDFRETAFYFPELTPDDNGEVELKFTMPESLTKWKVLALAHTKELAFGSTVTTAQTNKKLMLQPNLPRFVRQGDAYTLRMKVANESDSTIKCEVTLSVTDEIKKIKPNLLMPFPSRKDLVIPAHRSSAIEWTIAIPAGSPDMLSFNFVAKEQSSNKDKGSLLTDAVQVTLPVLPKNILITETLPLLVNKPGNQSFYFNRFIENFSRKGIESKTFSVEFTSNSTWTALLSLPYLIDYPYDCAEQTWNKFYGNALSAHIIASHPSIEKWIKKWNGTSSDTVNTSMQDDRQFKMIQEEMPWLAAGENEKQQYKTLATLSDRNTVTATLKRALDQIENMQRYEGGFSWFKGGTADRYITQVIVAGMGHLIKLNAIDGDTRERVTAMAINAIHWLDKEVIKTYSENGKLTEKSFDALDAHYLYARSFFPGITTDKTTAKVLKNIVTYWAENWTQQDKQVQSIIALAQYRAGEKKTANEILQSLKQTAVYDSTGTHWKVENNSSRWMDAPIETHSLLTEAFHEINDDKSFARDLNRWLLYNRLTQHWPTTKATADACYTLLLTTEPVPATDVRLTIGSNIITSSTNDTINPSGLLRKIFPASSVNRELGVINIQSSSPGNNILVGSGGVYWQYLQDIDSVSTSRLEGFSIEKKLFVQRVNNGKLVLELITANTRLQTGDHVVTRLEIVADRALDYVHVKDMRAATLEPTSQLSGYDWYNGLAIYKSVGDANMNFFIDHLPKGRSVIEYSSSINHSGVFISGIATAQCMYAPAFTAHSTAVKLTVQ